MIRPEARAWLARYAELGLALTLALPGLWFLTLGGYFFWPLGGVVVLCALVLAVFAWRRLRFQALAHPAAEPNGPGIVEIHEAQIGYFGPEGGGFVSQRELCELRLLARQGRRFWRLRERDGQSLLIPVAAEGAERLFEVFAALPGLQSSALVGVLETADPTEETGLGRVVWREPSALPGGTVLHSGA